MSEEKTEKKRRTKAKMVLVLLAAFLGVYFCFWVGAQVYTHYNPPVAADGKAIMLQGAIEDKERKDKKIQELREKSPEYR